MSASDLGPGQVRFSRGGQGSRSFGQEPDGLRGGGSNFAKPIFTVIAIAGLFYPSGCPSRKPASEQKVTSTFTPISLPPQATGGGHSPSVPLTHPSLSTPSGIDVQESIYAARSGTLVPPLTTCTEDSFSLNCLPAAPVKPSKVAVFSFQAPDRVSAD